MLGIKKGDEVIVPSFTHISTANAAIYCRAKPIFAEINPDTFTIDPEDVEKIVLPMVEQKRTPPQRHLN